MTQAPSTKTTRTPRPCLELGVCQHRKPACIGCPPAPYNPVALAPGVIDGPYRRESKVGAALRTLVAYLMRPHP